MTKKYERKPLIIGAAFYDPDLEKPEMPAQMEHLWRQYEASGDVECLAKAAEIAPFFGQPNIGRTIAKILRDKEPTDKLAREMQWREIDLLYEAFNNEGLRKTEIYERLAELKGITPESMKRELMRRYKT
jgi:hypothetical protein